jgi:hypothetical protein
MGPQSRTDPARATAETILARLGEVSHGVVARKELLAAGLTGKEIRRRIQTGSLIRVFPGVYRVGHAAPSIEARYMAAVKACGDRALLAGRAAGRLHCLFRGEAPGPEVLTCGSRRVAGILTHRDRTGDYGDADASSCRGIPVTSVPRTIVDLAAILSAQNLARAVHQAEVLHRVEPDEIEVILGRRHNWPGCRKLRAVLWGDTPVTLSRLESRFVQLLREGGLPLPQCNRPAGGRYVDCRWPAHRVTVELDSYRYHRTRQAWERDRAREREARARGDEFRRYTWQDVFRHPTPMLDDLRRVLERDHPRLWPVEGPDPGRTPNAPG